MAIIQFLRAVWGSRRVARWFVELLDDGVELRLEPKSLVRLTLWMVLSLVIPLVFATVVLWQARPLGEMVRLWCWAVGSLPVIIGLLYLVRGAQTALVINRHTGRLLLPRYEIEARIEDVEKWILEPREENSGCLIVGLKTKAGKVRQWELVECDERVLQPWLPQLVAACAATPSSPIVASVPRR